MSTQTQLITAEDLEEKYQNEYCELVNGELVTMTPPNDEHGSIAGTVSFMLNHHVRRENLGRVYVETGFLLTENPDTVLSADVSFVRTDRLPKEPYRTYPPMAPDLAVEVVSPGDRTGEVDEKAARWLEHGTKCVWVIWPQTRTVVVHESEKQPVRLHEGDTLSGGEIVPGFSCPVSEIFR